MTIADSSQESVTAGHLIQGISGTNPLTIMSPIEQKDRILPESYFQKINLSNEMRDKAI